MRYFYEKVEILQALLAARPPPDFDIRCLHDKIHRY